MNDNRLKREKIIEEFIKGLKLLSKDYYWIILLSPVLCAVSYFFNFIMLQELNV